MRAVSLADARIIETVNSRFIPLFIDYRAPNQPAEFMRISLDMDRQIRVATKEKEQIQMAVFRPSGEIVDGWPHAEKWSPDLVYRRLEDIVDREDLQAGDPVFPETTPASRKSRPDDLVLEITSRFLITEEQARLWDPLIRAESDRVNTWEYPPEDLILHRVKAPSVDWLVMSKPDWTTLVEPPGGGRASSWRVEGEPALRILRALVPPNELHLLTDDRLGSFEMTAHRTAREGDRVTIRLAGRIERNHPFWAEGDDDVAAAHYCGYVEYDTKRKEILSFRLATLDGTYRGQKSHPSLDIPWGVGIFGHP